MSPGDVDRAIACRGPAACGSTWPSTAAAARLQVGSGPIHSRPSSPTPPCATRSATSTTRYEHPNLDCSSARSSPNRSTRTWPGRAPAGFRQARPRSSPASIPGSPTPARQPGTIDPPTVDESSRRPPAAPSPPGTYDYALTARSPPARRSVDRARDRRRRRSTARSRVSFNAVCHAVGFDLYRRPARTALGPGRDPRPRRRRAHRRRRPADDLSRHRHGRRQHGGGAARRQRRRARALRPEPEAAAGLRRRGFATIATDASKGYPSVPTVITSPLLPAGASFTQGAVPPSRATRATSTTTSRARASSSTSTTGSTSRRPTAAVRPIPA